MKLLIDISDEEYKTLSKMSEKEKVNELSYYEKIIANGIPYESKGGMISREALKEKLKPCEADVCEFSCEGCHFRVVTAEDIDNAPTVDPMDEDAKQASIPYSYQMPKDYIKNKLDYSRPQGECCGSCYLCDVGDCGADMKGR